MSPKKGPSWRERPEYENPEAQWRETGDIGYAALAIGRWYVSFSWPEGDVPEWALEACADLYDRALTGIAPVLKKTQGGGPTEDDRALLDRVAREKNANPSLDTATIFRNVRRNEKGDQGDLLDANVKRLMRYWGKESKDPDGVVCNRHMSRVVQIDALAWRKRMSGRLKEDRQPGKRAPLTHRPDDK